MEVGLRGSSFSDSSAEAIQRLLTWRTNATTETTRALPNRPTTIPRITDNRVSYTYSHRGLKTPAPGHLECYGDVTPSSLRLQSATLGKTWIPTPGTFIWTQTRFAISERPLQMTDWPMTSDKRCSFPHSAPSR